MSVQISVLASSSAGNACLLATSTTKLLIDCGLGKRLLFERLMSAGVRPSEISACIISHQHSDHAGQIQSVTANLPISVYLSEATNQAIQWNSRPPLREIISSMSPFQIGNIEIMPFSVPHDCDNLGFRFRAEGVSISFATDLGRITPKASAFLSGTDVLMLESNWDPNMLGVGPYSWKLKERVMGHLGHLSNDACCAFLRSELCGRTATVILGHLSENNNHPAIVESFAAAALAEAGLTPRLIIANAKTATETVVCG